MFTLDSFYFLQKTDVDVEGSAVGGNRIMTLFQIWGSS